MSALGFIAIVVLLLVLRVNLVLILMVGATYAHMVWGGGEIEYFIQDVWSSMDREAILAVPLFIFVGSIMSRGTIAKRLVAVVIAITRPIPGGLGVATILSCAVFSAISGSSIVTMLVVGSVLYPALLENGYSKKFAIGALCAGGTLGIIIPPSIPMIIYGLVTESSITDLFKAGIGPGILLTSVFSIYAIALNWRMERKPFQFSELAASLADGLPSLMMPVILLGGIYSGYFSATEAAAVAILYAILIDVIFYRELKFRDYLDLSVDSAKLIGALFPLIAVAVSVNILLVQQRVPQYLITFMLENIDSQIAFLFITNFLLLLAGCFLDTASALAISAPLLKPIAEAYGVNATHLGIIMILNLEIGILTPPLGLNLIVAMTAYRERFGTICIAAVPFVLLMLACLILITFQPWIALALVN
ncbi:MAG: TRAP transporter large permease [Notoacmeibacter sp.]|nr:TRAP transporter large permease [Notoacmeibacter sp.]